MVVSLLADASLCMPGLPLVVAPCEPAPLLASASCRSVLALKLAV
jgi:hypothetical protein